MPELWLIGLAVAFVVYMVIVAIRLHYKNKYLDDALKKVDYSDASSVRRWIKLLDSMDTAEYQVWRPISSWGDRKE